MPILCRLAKHSLVWAALLGACQHGASDSPSGQGDAAASNENSFYFADFPEPHPLGDAPLSGFSLVERQRYGTLDGLGALDVVSQVAVTDSFVVALQFRSCEFVVFARTTGQALRRFGHCGRGPDDYWDMSQGAITSHGDTLMVVDRYGHRLRRVSLRGEILSTSSIDSTLLAPQTGMARFDLLSDSSTLISVNLPAHRRVGGTIVTANPTGSFLRSIDRNRGILVDTAFREGLAVAANVMNSMRTPIACPIIGGKFGIEVVVLNRWEPQLVVVPLNSLHAPILNVMLPASIPTHPLKPDAAGNFRPLGSAEIACGDSVAIASRRPVNATNEPPELAEMYVYSSADSSVLFERFDLSHAAALGRLAAAHGNRSFMIHNSQYDYPVITEMEFVSSRGSKTSAK